MPNIISPYYFKGTIAIPNSSELPVSQKINTFINIFEPKCIEQMLGEELYFIYKTQPQSQRILDIINGANYINAYGSAAIWNGLTEEYENLIACFVYYEISSNSASLTTGVSTAVPNTDGAVSVSPAEKMIYAWNVFSEKSYKLMDFLWSKKDLNGARAYTEFSSYNMRCSFRNCKKINLFYL